MAIFCYDDISKSGGKEMKPVKATHFGIQRKIVANMTSESWYSVPHAGPVVEFDVTDLLATFDKLRASGKLQYKLSINTLMLKIIAEGLKSAQNLNAHITYDSRYVKGKVELFDEIHFSVPMALANGEMMTLIGNSNGAGEWSWAECTWWRFQPKK